MSGLRDKSDVIGLDSVSRFFSAPAVPNSPGALRKTDFLSSHAPPPRTLATCISTFSLQVTSCHLLPLNVTNCHYKPHPLPPKGIRHPLPFFRACVCACPRLSEAIRG